MSFGERFRHRHTRPVGRGRIDKHRRNALIMVLTGAARTVAWLALTAAYLLHIPFATGLFGTVSFVAVLSSLALAETAWSQVAGSLAQLTAGDASRTASDAAIERDIAKLADLQPGPKAQQLAEDIRRRLTS